MNATERHVKSEIKRLAGTAPALYPAEGAREILNALLRNCQSDEHVSGVVTAFLENSTECRNMVAELVRIARGTRKSEEPPPGCDFCWLGPDGFTGEVRWAAHVQVQRNGYDCAVRCQCERGQWLKRRDEAGGGITTQAPRKPPNMTPDADVRMRAAGERE